MPDNRVGGFEQCDDRDRRLHFSADQVVWHTVHLHPHFLKVVKGGGVLCGADEIREEVARAKGRGKALAQMRRNAQCRNPTRGVLGNGCAIAVEPEN